MSTQKFYLASSGIGDKRFLFGELQLQGLKEGGDISLEGLSSRFRASKAYESIVSVSHIFNTNVVRVRVGSSGFSSELISFSKLDGQILFLTFPHDGGQASVGLVFDHRFVAERG